MRIESFFRALALVLALAWAAGGSVAQAAFPGERGRIVFQAADSSVRSMEFNGTDVALRKSGGEPAYSPDGRRIAYRSSLSPNTDSEIIVIDADGSNSRQLTNNNFNDHSPAFSPDGERVVFRSERPGGAGLFIVDVDGSNERRLTTGNDDHPEFFPDGNTIIFDRQVGEDSDIMTAEIGGSQVVVRGLLTGPERDVHPTVSPDGEKIAFARSGRIVTANADGEGLATIRGGNTNFEPAFSPHAGGAQIVFRRFVESEGYQIWRMNSDGSNLTHVMSGFLRDVEPNWGPAPPPQARIESGPAAVTSQTFALFTLAAPRSLMAGPADRFECRLDKLPFEPCFAVKLYEALPDGTHTFRVKGINDTGEGPVSSFTWRVDTQPPETEITDGPGSPTRHARPTFRFSSSEEGSSFVWAFDGAEFVPCSHAERHRPSGPLTDGEHTFSVRAVDAAGNVDPTPAELGFTVDTKAPNVVLTKKPRRKLVAKGRRARARFAFRASERGAAFECALSGRRAPKRQRRFRKCRSPQVLQLRPGKYLFRVRARDAAGNVDPSPARQRLLVVRR